MQKFNKTKNGLYKAYIVTGKDKNGKPKRKYVYSKSAKELDKKLTELKALYHKGIVIDNTNLTFKDLGEKWFEITQSHKEYNTKESIKRILKLHVYPTLGYIPLKALKAYQIQELVNQKLNEGLTDTVRKMLNYINSILNLAVANDFILKNVAINIKLPHFKNSPKKSLTKFERSIIEKVAENHKHGDMILTFLYTGIRREELIPLRKSDVFLKDKYIKIDKATVFIHNQANIKDTKNGDSRYIPLLNKITKILEFRCQNTSSEYLFPMSNGKMMSETSFREAMNSFIKECNKYIDNINKNDENKYEHIHFTAHILRHTFCTFLYYSGIKLKKAQEIMGHRSSKMTLDIYTHLDEEQEKNAKEIIDNYLENIPKFSTPLVPPKQRKKDVKTK